MSAILTCDAGPDSFKASLFDHSLNLKRQFITEYTEDHPHLHILGPYEDWQESLPLIEASDYAAVDALMDWVDRTLGWDALTVAGHRVTHGGTRFSAPDWVNNDTMKAMRELIPLAPLHQPHNLAAITRIRQRYPHLPQVACFDTSFHNTNPWMEKTYALPQELRDKGVRRYGFHGLAYEYIASILSDVLPPEKRERVIAVHMSGCSACALKNGKSIATTMGFAALDGLVRHRRFAVPVPDMPLPAYGHAADTGADLSLKSMEGDEKSDPLAAAAPAAEWFSYMAACSLGGLVAVLGGMQAMIFTGTDGVNAMPMREQILRYFTWIPDLKVVMAPANEALVIARHAQHLIESGRTAPAVSRAA